jgi:hypothetical protein
MGPFWTNAALLLMPLYMGCLLLTFSGCHRRVSPETEQYLQTLLNRKDYFALRKELQLRADEISKDKLLYLTAFVDNAFNRNAASANKIQQLLQPGARELSDSAKSALLQLEEDNYFKTFQYALAAAVDSELIRSYRHVLDSAGYADIQNTSQITHGLSSIPAQQTMIRSDASFPWKKDKIGLMEIPVRFHDSIWSCIFDTRANISSISASYAKKLGVKMLGVSYREGSGATGNRFLTSLGVADSLWLGAVLLQHVVFQVMPDEILYLAPVDFQLNAIIGYPVIASLREIHVFRNGSMTIPAHPGGSTLNNLAMDGLDPIVSVIIGSDTLCFQFDTGATSTDFYSNYFRKHKKDILAHGKASTIRTGGAGGVVQQEVYRLNNLKLTVGSRPATLPGVDVHVRPIPNNPENFYGNLGQDLITQFNEMILNFQDMYIDFK